MANGAVTIIIQNVVVVDQNKNRKDFCILGEIISNVIFLIVSFLLVLLVTPFGWIGMYIFHELFWK